MPRVTKKALEENIEQLKRIKDYNLKEISRLNAEIEDMKNKENVVSKVEFLSLVKDLKRQELMTSEYKRLYDDLREKYTKEREALLNTINDLKEALNSSEIKLNERGAGRKAYSNKEIIEKIYDLYLNGSSLQNVANELNRSGIKTKRGKEWAKSSVRFILLNPKNVSSGFISEDIFNRTVKLLNDNKKVK